VARGAQSALEARSGGSTSNGGGFCYSGPTYPTDLASTNGTSSTPSVTSASYTFVAGDVGNYLYIKSGTSWKPGLYQIASVAGGAATLSGAVGTAATLSGGTWAVDYTQQNAAQFSGTDLVVDATTNTKVTSATHTFTPADVGNWIRITAGAGFTTGWYQINSVAGGAATLDSSPAAVGTTGGTWALGGAVLITDLPNAMVASNQAYVKAGGWASLTASIVFSINCTPSATVPASHLSGYTTTRGDGGQVSLTLATNSNLIGLQVSQGWVVEGFNINCSSLAGSEGVQCGNTSTIFRNLKISNAAGNGGIYLGLATACTAAYCEVTGCTSLAAVYFNGSPQCFITNCWVHDNSCTGINMSGGGPNIALFNVVSNNSGASSDGIQLGNNLFIVEHNTIYKNGRHGVMILSANFGGEYRCRNNLITDHTAGSGIKQNTSAWPASPEYDGNFYYNNLQHRTNIDDCNPTANSNSTYTNLVYLSGPYTNTLDVFLTASPYVNAATNDFRLNSTAGGGAAVRGAGTPGSSTASPYNEIPGLGLAAYPDGGALQHQDAGGGSTTFIPINRVQRYFSRTPAPRTRIVPLPAAASAPQLVPILREQTVIRRHTVSRPRFVPVPAAAAAAPIIIRRPPPVVRREIVRHNRPVVVPTKAALIVTRPTLVR